MGTLIAAEDIPEGATVRIAKYTIHDGVDILSVRSGPSQEPYALDLIGKAHRLIRKGECLSHEFDGNNGYALDGTKLRPL